MKRYTGTCRNEYLGDARITVENDGLVMSLCPVPEVFPLRHWDGNIFAYYPVGENALGTAAVTFDPKHKTVTVENPDENGIGTITMSNRHTSQIEPEFLYSDPKPAI